MLGKRDFFHPDIAINHHFIVVEEMGVPCISVVNVVGSLIARSTGLGVYLNAGRENAVASTKAFTTQVTVLSLVALWFRQQKVRASCDSVRPNLGCLH